jgi:hypothetical protein
VKLGDLALAHRHQPDAGEAEALEDAGDVLLVARQPVERLGDHQLEALGAGVLEQPVGLGAVPQARAADRVVGIDADDLRAEALGVLAAEPDLVVDRALALLVGAVTGIDGGTHGARV